MRPVLGIETSCDETAAAVLASDGTVLSELVLSQRDHSAFGGVVPEIAARAHIAHLPAMVAEVMEKAGLGYADLEAIAATSGPGLIGGLIVTETVFNIPGVARFLVEAIRWRDYPMVQNLVMFIALVVVTVNLIVDLLYMLVDPRIRYSE